MKAGARTKIGRLPRDVRAEVTRRLCDGEAVETLLAWINAHPLTCSVLDLYFHGQAVTAANLAAWKDSDEYRQRAQDEAAIRRLVSKSRRAAEQFRGRWASLPTKGGAYP